MRPFVLAVILAGCASRPSAALPLDRCNEVLARYARGASLDEVTRDMSLGDRTEAREALHRALIVLQRRYYRDR